MGLSARALQGPLTGGATLRERWVTGSLLLLALFVPVFGQEKALVGVLALGERRSEAAYTSEDRQLLASIAAVSQSGT